MKEVVPCLLWGRFFEEFSQTANCPFDWPHSSADFWRATLIKGKDFDEDDTTEDEDEGGKLLGR